VADTDLTQEEIERIADDATGTVRAKSDDEVIADAVRQAKEEEEEGS
jgi:hypothetical protein